MAPLTLPLLHLVCLFCCSAGNSASNSESPEIFDAITSNTIMVIGMTLLVAVFAFVGSFVGLKIGRELQKSGVMKNA